jgi:hypothetical protein
LAKHHEDYVVVFQSETLGDGIRKQMVEVNSKVDVTYRGFFRTNLRERKNMVVPEHSVLIKSARMSDVPLSLKCRGRLKVTIIEKN